MKKILFIALAIVAMASCTKKKLEPMESVSSDKPIVFSTPVVSKTTKSAAASTQIISGTDYKIGTTYPNFKVYAKYTASSFDSWSAGTDFFTATGEEVQKQDNVKDSRMGWHPTSKTYFWPKKGYLTFAAYSPATASPATIGNNGVQFTDYVASTTKDGQVDLLYSARVVDKHNWSTESISADGNKDVNSDLYGVNIPFYHALSQIVFTLKIKDGLTLSEITDYVQITSLTLSKMNTKASFTQDLADDAKTGDDLIKGSNIGWTMASPAVITNDYANIAEGETVKVNNESTSYVMMPYLVIPQNLENGENAQVVNITYTSFINGVTEEGLTTSVKLSDLKSGTPATNITKLEMGKKYTIDIIFDLEKIYFAPTIVTDWETVALTGGIEI